MPRHLKRPTCKSSRALRHASALSLAALEFASCAHAAPAFDSASPWMLGDWGGKRSELSEQGYDFKLD
ncbi:MAG: porin, partial [Pseudomonas sp.]